MDKKDYIPVQRKLNVTFQQSSGFNIQYVPGNSIDQSVAQQWTKKKKKMWSSSPEEDNLEQIWFNKFVKHRCVWTQ